MTSAVIGATLFGAIVILYMAICLGAPLGEYAMGGKYKVVPLRNRAAIAVSILIQLFGIVVLLQQGNVMQVGLPEGVVRISCYVFAVYLSLNVFMNAFSRSKKERWMMTPLSAIVATCYWLVIFGV